MKAEFPKFVTTYDEAYRIIEKYENSSTSKFVLTKNLGMKVKWHCIYSCFKNFLVVCSPVSVQFRSGFRDLLVYSFVHLLM